MNKWIRIFIVIVIVISVGFFQERLKVNINFILEKSTQIPHFFSLSPQDRIVALSPLKQQGNFDYYYSHRHISMLYELDLEQLKILKWFVTGISVCVHFLINILILYFFKAPKYQFKLLFLLTLLIFLIALFSQLFGTLLNLSQEFYPISRGLMGILQTPLIAIIFLIASNFLSNGSRQQHQ